MYRAIIRTILIILTVAWLVSPLVCIASSGKRLMTINNTEYTDEDFRNWWRHWNDKNTLEFPRTPNEFVEFQLMVQQGIDMGYDTQPNYLRKLDVFLQVKAMMALKYEEIDSKAAVTDAELAKYFNENYSPVWDLQVHAYDNESKAKKAYEMMLPFQGQASGQLAFADLAGGSVEEKPDTYDEVKVSADDFRRNKIESWLSVVRKLQEGEVCKPFINQDNGKYILLRLVKIQPAEEGLFEKKRRKMTEVLNKEKRNQLSNKLIENLSKKYNVRINHELLNSIKFGNDYPREFLEQQVVSMDGFSATVYDVMTNVVKEKKVRKDTSDEQLKKLVLDTIISQTLIYKESLARGYEKRPPLLWTYEFYKQNRLKGEVEAGLMKGIVVTDQEVKDYYNKNIADFTVQEKATFSLLKGDLEVLKKIWVGTLSGGDFTELAQKYSLNDNVQSQDVVSLSPEIISEIKKLEKGNVSLPFDMLGGSYGLIKLIDRSPGQVTEFDKVKGQIVDQLKKSKYEAVRFEYLNKLKARSKIEIKEGVWNALEREYGKKD